MSPRERADHAAGRLRELLSEGLGPNDISARARGKGWAVYARGGLIMIATAAEAKERDEEPRDTARRWAANLKSALTGMAKAGGRKAPVKVAEKPAAKRVVAAKPSPKKAATLGVASHSVPLPVGETRVVGVIGTAAGPIEARVEETDIASVRPVPGKAAVEVRGLMPGRAVVRVNREGKEAAFAVWVKKYAGRVKEVPVAEVTGESTPASIVRTVAEDRALDGVEKEPGAAIKVTGDPQGVRALGRAQSTEVLFPITIHGEGYLPVKTHARVRVKNVELEAQQTKDLLYSNNPESVRDYGTLYQALVENTGTARLFYHHQNRMGHGFVFQIHLINPGDTPADVQVVQADAGPILNTIQVGHRAAARYLQVATADIGYIARIPARGTRLIYSTGLPHLLTVSGIYNLRVVSGGSVVVHVAAASAVYRPQASPELVAKARSQPAVFPSPQKDQKFTYTVGEHWCFVPLGRKAIPAKDPETKLQGNYGVLYNITVELDNPTDAAKTVKVLLSAEAGWTRGAFVIDGRLIEAPHIAPPAVAELWSVKLEPQERRTVTIQGIPAGGAFYPVSLVVRS
jgi:hypothetical protein